MFIHCFDISPAGSGKVLFGAKVRDGLVYDFGGITLLHYLCQTFGV